MKPEDTSKRSAEEHIIKAAGMGLERYITGMERGGQAGLLRSEMLPVDMGGLEALDRFKALGFEFSEDPAHPDADGLFIEAKLPEGWTREGSRHAMWSYILDEDGYQRVSIFYKAAFYDRRAFMGLISPDRQMTMAQQRAFDDRYHHEFPFSRYGASKGRREGPNYVYRFEEQVVGSDGDRVYRRNEDGSLWRDEKGDIAREMTGHWCEVVVAPNGEELERRGP